MSNQKVDNKIQFDIVYDSSNKASVAINKERDKKISDITADVIIESIVNSFQESMKEILKYEDKAIKIIHSIKLTTISFGMDYLKYLHEERKKYGDDGIKDHIIALGQATVGHALGAAAGLGGGIVGAGYGTVVNPGVGTALGASIGGWTGAVSNAVIVSVAYDNEKIYGQPLKDHVRDFIASISGKEGEQEQNKAVNEWWTEKVTLPNLVKDDPNFFKDEGKKKEFGKILSSLSDIQSKSNYEQYLVYTKYNEVHQCYSFCTKWSMNKESKVSIDYNIQGYYIPFIEVRDSIRENKYGDLQFICSTYEDKSLLYKWEELNKSDKICYFDSCGRGFNSITPHNNSCNKNLELFSTIIKEFNKEVVVLSTELYLSIIYQYNLIEAYNNKFKDKFLDKGYEEKLYYDEINSFLYCNFYNSLVQPTLYLGLINYNISLSDDNIYFCIQELSDSQHYPTIYERHQELLVHILSNYKFNAYAWQEHRLLDYTIGLEPHGAAIADALIFHGAKVEKNQIYRAISNIQKCTNNENNLSLINLFIRNKPEDLDYIYIFSYILSKIYDLNEDQPKCLLDIYLDLIHNYKLIDFVNNTIELKKQADIEYWTDQFLDCSFISSFTATDVNYEFPIKKINHFEYKEHIFDKLYYSLIAMGIKFTKKNIENCIPKLAMHQDILEKILERSEYDGNEFKVYAYSRDPDPENMLMHLTERNYSKVIIEDLIKKGARPNARAVYNSIKLYDSMVIKNIIEALPNKLNTNGEYEYVVSGGKAITTALSRICKYLDVPKNLYCTSGNIHGFADFQLPITSYGLSYYRKYFFHNSDCNSPIYNEESEYINSALLEIINILNLLFDYGLKAEEGMGHSYMMYVFGHSIPLYDLSEYSEKILDLMLKHYNPKWMDLEYNILRCLYSSNKCINFFTKTLNKFSLTGSIGQPEQILVSSSKEDNSCINEENRLSIIEIILNKIISQYSADKEIKSEVTNYISSFMILAFRENKPIVEKYINKYFISYLAKNELPINKDLISKYLLLYFKDEKNYIDEICSVSKCNINFFTSFSEDYFTICAFPDLFISPLELVIINNDYDLAKSLINYGADINVYNSHNISAHVNDIKKYQNVTWIIQHYEVSNKKENCIIKASDYYKSYLLYKEGNDHMGCLLKADILTTAIQQNNLDMVKLLLDRGVNIYKCAYNYVCYNSNGETEPFIANELQVDNIDQCISPTELSKEMCEQTSDCSIYHYLIENINKQNIHDIHEEL